MSTPPPIRKISPPAQPTVASAPQVEHAPALDPLETIPTLGEQATAETDAQAIDRMRCEQVTISYGGKIAVNAVDLPVRQGEVLALIGPSGCGKTTLLRSLNRLTELTPTAARGGRITLDEQDIDALEVTYLETARVDGLPAAEPVPDVDLRQRRLRAARTRREAASASRSDPSSSRR